MCSSGNRFAARKPLQLMSACTMLVGSLIGADLDSSVLSDNNADLADIRNLNEQTLAINTLSDELAITHKLFSGFCLEKNLLNQALALC